MLGCFHQRVSIGFLLRCWDPRLCSKTVFSFVLPALIKPNRHIQAQQRPALLVQVQVRQTESHPCFSVARAVTAISIRTMEVSMLD